MLRKITHRDSTQVNIYEHDQEKDAKRVIIVGGEMPKFDIALPEQKIQTIEVPVIVKELQFKEVDRIIIQKELQIEKVEIPVIIQKTEVITIEKPVIVKEIEFKEVEKQVIVYRTEYKDLTKWVSALLAIQVLTSIILLLKK